jgi:hypothetical protein
MLPPTKEAEVYESEESGSLGVETSVAGGAAKVGRAQSRKKSSKVTRDGHNLSGEFEGEQGNSMSGTALGAKNEASQTTGAKTELTPDGKQLADFNQEMSLEGLLAVLARYKSKLQGHKIGNKGVRAIIRRAKNTKKWDRMYIHPNAAGDKAWNDLGSYMVNPSIKWPWFQMEWADIPGAEDQIVKLCRMAHIADYMSNWARKGGMEAWQRVLNEWNPTSQGGDIGTRFEWKGDLKPLKKIYDQLFKEMQSLDSILSKLDNDFARRAWLASRLTKIELVRISILKFDDFDDNRAKIEMVSSLDKWKEQAIDALGKLEAPTKKSKPSRYGSGPEPKQKPSGLSKILGQIETKLDLLLVCKGEEKKIMKEYDGCRSNTSRAKVEDKYVNLWETWVREIRRTRSLYTKAEIPVEQWKVSVKYGGRQFRYEPSYSLFFDKIQAHRSTGISAKARVKPYKYMEDF